MSRLLGKFVQDSTITDLQIRLRNNLALRARNAGNTADVEILKISPSDILQILRETSLESNKITNLAEGTAATDAVNLGQVQSLINGLTDPKDAARAATTAALPTATYINGVSGTGATLTADANGAIPSQDGVALAIGNRLLVKDQASAVENGIYDVTQLGDAGTPFILTRSVDASIGGGDATTQPKEEQVTQGMYVPVAEGTSNGALGFIMTTVDPISLGTSNLTFVQLGETITAGQGLTKSGSTLSVDAGDGLGFSGNQLVVLVDNDPVDGTTDIKAGVVVSRIRGEEEFILNATDISNAYIDLAIVASRASVLLFPRFGIRQKDVVDYTVSYTGGTGGKTRISFTGDLGSIVEDGDVLDVNFETLDY